MFPNGNKVEMEITERPDSSVEYFSPPQHLEQFGVEVLVLEQIENVSEVEDLGVQNVSRRNEFKNVRFRPFLEDVGYRFELDFGALVADLKTLGGSSSEDDPVLGGVGGVEAEPAGRGEVEVVLKEFSGEGGDHHAVSPCVLDGVDRDSALRDFPQHVEFAGVDRVVGDNHLASVDFVHQKLLYPVLDPLPLLVLVKSLRVVEKLLENSHGLVPASRRAEFLLEGDRVALHRDLDALVLTIWLAASRLAGDVAKHQCCKGVPQGREVDEVGAEEVLGGFVIIEPLRKVEVKEHGG
jgi:hypothetical protein